MTILLILIIIILLVILFISAEKSSDLEIRLYDYIAGAKSSKSTYNRMYQTILRRDMRIQNLLKKINNLKHNTK